MLVAIFTLGCIPVSAGFYASETASGFYLGFETEADFRANGNKEYYKLESGEGAGFGGSNGALKLDGSSSSNESQVGTGMQTSVGLKTGDINYKISFRYMAKTGDSAPQNLYLVLRATNHNESGSSKNLNTDKVNLISDGKWYEYSYDFNFNDFNGTEVTSMDSFVVCFRMDDGDSVAYVDDLIVEPYTCHLHLPSIWRGKKF